MTEPDREDYDVVILGGGPSGLSAAVELRKLGVQNVVVLEREQEAGGIPRHCAHPPFGFREYGRIMTGPAYARKNVARTLQAGVEIRCGTTAVALRENGLVTLATPQGMRQIKGKRVILCLGARERPRSDRLIGGTRPLGVINTGALQVAVNLKHLLPFKKPLIAGTELVSLSSILTCRHAGIRPVAMIETASHPVARWPLTMLPRLAGIPLIRSAQLLSIEGETRVQRAIIRRENGVVDAIECDGVLLTGQFTPESALPRISGLAIDAGTGGPFIDQYGRCSDKSYFAAGNLLRPIETAGWCWREGRHIAAIVAKDLANGLPADANIDVRVAAPIRYAMPQILHNGTQTELQLRMTRRAKGTIIATQSGREIASSRGGFKPERRILLKLPATLQPNKPVEISIKETP